MARPIEDPTAKARREVEAGCGYRIPDNVWRAIIDFFGEPVTTDTFDDFVEWCPDALKIYEEALLSTGSKQSCKPRNPTRRGIRYPKSFNERYDLWLFVDVETIGKPANAWLMGEAQPEAPSWRELWSRYKKAVNPRTGRPYEYVPQTPKAFEMRYRAADKELGSLSDEDRAAWRLQDYVDVIEEYIQGHIPTGDAGMCHSFRVVRNGKAKEALPQLSAMVGARFNTLARWWKENMSPCSEGEPSQEPQETEPPLTFEECLERCPPEMREGFKAQYAKQIESNQRYREQYPLHSSRRRTEGKG